MRQISYDGTKNVLAFLDQIDKFLSGAPCQLEIITDLGTLTVKLGQKRLNGTRFETVSIKTDRNARIIGRRGLCQLIEVKAKS